MSFAATTKKKCKKRIFCLTCPKWYSNISQLQDLDVTAESHVPIYLHMNCRISTVLLCTIINFTCDSRFHVTLMATFYWYSFTLMRTVQNLHGWIITAVWLPVSSTTERDLVLQLEPIKVDPSTGRSAHSCSIISFWRQTFTMLADRITLKINSGRMMWHQCPSVRLFLCLSVSLFLYPSDTLVDFDGTMQHLQK